MKRGLYLHLPFCARKCHYCNFVISVRKDPESRKRFFQALEKEIRWASRYYGPLYFETVYLGGGTPSLLTAAELEWLFSTLHHYFVWPKMAEVTFEVNPGDADAGLFRMLRKWGVNRISLGAQSFQDGMLKKIGRVHTVCNIYETFQYAREAGYENMSLDLICRLPGQSAEDFLGSIQAGLALQPAQFSIYDLEIHPKTLFGMRERNGDLELPSELEHEVMMRAAEDILSRAGYAQYALGAFAQRGKESVHNLIYWHNEEYLGLGPGAFSYMNGIRYQFTDSVRRYLDKCESGHWDWDIWDQLTVEEKEMETLLTGLRLASGVEVLKVGTIFPKIASKLRALIAEELLQENNERLMLTQRGRFLAEHTFAALADFS